MPPRLSGLQKEVYSLYRQVIREAAKKECTDYAKAEFRKRAKLVKKTDFKTIEHNIRTGRKHLKLMAMPGVKVFGGSS